MGALLSFARDFESIECANCGTLFCMTESMARRRREDGDSFFCPNGHKNFYRETAVQKLQKELEQEKKRRQWAEEARQSAFKREESALKSRNAMKGVVTKIKNRVSNGVCPCCNRTFQNLHRHMKMKHPDFSKEDVK